MKLVREREIMEEEAALRKQCLTKDLLIKDLEIKRLQYEVKSLLNASETTVPDEHSPVYRQL